MRTFLKLKTNPYPLQVLIHAQIQRLHPVLALIFCSPGDALSYKLCKFANCALVSINTRTFHSIPKRDILNVLQ